MLATLLELLAKEGNRQLFCSRLGPLIFRSPGGGGASAATFTRRGAAGNVAAASTRAEVAVSRSRVPSHSRCDPLYGNHLAARARRPPAHHRGIFQRPSKAKSNNSSGGQVRNRWWWWWWWGEGWGGAAVVTFIVRPTLSSEREARQHVWKSQRSSADVSRNVWVHCTHSFIRLICRAQRRPQRSHSE